MEFVKPEEWGTRYQFPENMHFEYDGQTHTLANEIAVKMAEKYDTFIADQIAMEARAEGISDLTVLNKTAILDALKKQIPQKPIFVDTRFRNHGRSIADGCSISKCYKCPNPNCMSHIFHVWDSEKYCVHCGQALDWEDE